MTLPLHGATAPVLALRSHVFEFVDASGACHFAHQLEPGAPYEAELGPPRVVSVVRAEDTVTRIGGDEFVVLVEHPVTRAHATRVADKLDRALCLPYDALGSEVVLRASIGVALFPDDADGPDCLLKAADDAMFAVKDARADGARRSSRS